MSVEQIMFFSAQIDKIEEESALLLKELDSILLIIPGMAINSFTAIMKQLETSLNLNQQRKL